MTKRKRKEQTKRSWMVGLLIVAMLAFIASQIPWDKIIQRSKSKAATTAASQSTASKSTQQSNTVFEKEGGLTVIGTDGTEKAKIDIEVSDSEEERNLGLMYRRNLPSQGGMLFIFDKDAPRNFWMKNTILSLDFLFIDSKNTVVDIKENIPPMSEQGVPSAAPAQYVLELNAGFAGGYNLQVGDKVVIDLTQ